MKYPEESNLYIEKADYWFLGIGRWGWGYREQLLNSHGALSGVMNTFSSKAVTTAAHL